MNIAVIPARGGSNRIPRKNIKLFHGLPIIAYAIKIAQETDIFDEVIVSTDDEEIAEVARNFGATVPWMRAKELSTDHATTISVMQDAVRKINSSTKGIENFCCIYPTTPLLEQHTINEGLHLLNVGNWGYVFSGLRVKGHPQKFFSLGNSKGIEMLFPEYEQTRTQDLATYYKDAGQFYWGKKTAWESGLPIFTNRSTIIEIPEDSVIDIDTPEDWHYAETLFEIKKRG